METPANQIERKKAIYRVTIIGSIGNFALVVFKFIAGIVGRSDAMLADAAHSLSDFITDIIVIIFVGLSSKPQDKDHAFGHGKYETLATGIIALFLLGAGVGIFWKSATAIWAWWQGDALEQPGMLALIAAVVSIVIKEGLYQYTVRKGRVLGSQAVIANAWHHRSDALSSIGATLGIAGAIFLGVRFRVLDPLAAAIVSFFIVRTAYKLVMPSIDELLEKALPEATEQQIMDVISGYPQISNPHNLRTRKVGNRNVVDLHLRMDGNTTINTSHALVSEIEHKLRQFLGPDAIITIHVEPKK